MPRVAKKHIQTSTDAIAAKEGCYFDQAAADHVCEFVEQFLVLSKGEWAGHPFKLQPWQRRLLQRLYGWKRKDGARRFRHAYISVAKKNGKSALLSALALYHLVADGEAGAEVYCCACDRDQARIVWEESKNMVEASKTLGRRLDLVPSTKRIVYSATKSFFHAISSIAGSKEGYNASLVIIDELHRQPNDDLFRTLQYSGAARRQPLFVCITTAGVDRNSICYRQYEYAKKVEAGVIEDTSFFVWIAEADPSDDVDDPKTWMKANPSLGVTIEEESFRQELKAAQDSPTSLNSFLRYRLNLWTDAFDTWILDSKWQACERELPNLDGRPCYAGLDLSSTTDVTALSLVFPLDGGCYAVKPYFWIPGDSAEQRERRDKVPYLTWERQGFITLTDGNVVDYDLVRAELGRLAARYSVRQVAIDRWNATQLSTQLQGDGFNVVAFGQGFASMSAPTKELERLVLGGQLQHDGNPVMRWMVSNAAIEQDPAGNIKPSKKKSVERIDGVVATAMALGIAAGQPVVSPIYHDRDLLFSLLPKNRRQIGAGSPR